MIEELLYKHLHEKGQELEPHLAKFKGKMAIFNQEAPKDTDAGWESKTQYGRIVFDIDTTQDTERKVSGVLLVDISTEKTQTPPEYIEPIVKELIDGYFFSSPDLTMAAQWKASNYFTEPTKMVNGVTLTFDLLAFPNQLTEEPDPVKTANDWLKELYPDAKIIGEDNLPEAWKPTDEAPAFYCRLIQLGNGRMPSSAAVTWIGATMRIGVMAPSEQVRASIAKKCIQVLNNETRLMMKEGDEQTPMLIDDVSVDLASDQVRVGQLLIKGTYGVLNTYTGTPLKNVYVAGMGIESEVPRGN